MTFLHFEQGGTKEKKKVKLVKKSQQNLFIPGGGSFNSGEGGRTETDKEKELKEGTLKRGSLRQQTGSKEMDGEPPDDGLVKGHEKPSKRR